MRGRWAEGIHHRGGLEIAVLAPLSLLYMAGWEAYRAAYRLGLKQPSEPHRPVVCVGNLTVGGTGKTPLVAWLAGALRGMGRQVAISASGYGSPAAEAAQVAPEGPLDPAKWGDEPALLRHKLPDVPLIVGRRRVLAAELCAQRFPDAVLLMDDGFQHLPLKKHLTVLVRPLYDASRLCLPAGPYRESASAYARADLVLPGHRFDLERSAPYLVEGSRRLAEAEIRGLEIDLLCAIGQPYFLQWQLEELGATVCDGRFLADHDPLTAGNLLGELGKRRPLVVTAKDWVKLSRRGDLAGRRILVADYDSRPVPEDEFRAWLSERLDDIEAKSPRT